MKQEGLAREQLPSQAELVREAGVAWLSRRAESCGFNIDPQQVRAKGYHQVRFLKGRRKVSLSGLDLSGLLTVVDPERFMAVLYGGIGPVKGYGFGLLLVRPARS